MERKIPKLCNLKQLCLNLQYIEQGREDARKPRTLRRGRQRMAALAFQFQPIVDITMPHSRAHRDKNRH